MAYLVIATGPSAGVSYQLTDAPLIGGREANRDLQLVDPKVSRRHFVVRKQGENHEIAELDAKNGVYVNGKRAKSATLNDGDKITVGDTEMVYRSTHGQGAIDAVHRGRVLSRETTAKTVTSPRKGRLK